MICRMRSTFGRAAAAAGAFLICGSVFADVTLFSPSARVLPSHSAVIYGLYDTSPGFWRAGDIRVGLGSGLEADFDAARGDDGTGRQSLNLEYQRMGPFPGVPGLAFGLLDLAGTTKAGTRAYVVMTQEEDLFADLSHDLTAEFSLGLAMGSQLRPFVGVKIPLGSQLKLLAEHDGYTVNAGIEFDPSPSFAISEVCRGSVTMLKASYKIRF